MKSFKQFLDEGIIKVDTNEVTEALAEALAKLEPRLTDRSLNDHAIAVRLSGALKKFRISFSESDRYGEEISDKERRHALGLDDANLGDGFLTITFLDNLAEVLADKSNHVKFVEAFKSLVGHEFVHVKQIERQKVKSNRSFMKDYDELVTRDDIRKYLSDRQEMMAWAYEASSELLASLKQDVINSKLTNDIGALSKESDAFKKFTAAFSKSEDSYRRFIKLVHQYVNA